MGAADASDTFGIGVAVSPLQPLRVFCIRHGFRDASTNLVIELSIILIVLMG